MSKFDGLKYSQSATPEEKLQVIRHEFVRQIAIVNGYASILKDAVNEAVAKNGISEDCNEWVSKLLEASEDMKEILDIMTSNPQ